MVTQWRKRSCRFILLPMEDCAFWEIIRLFDWSEAQDDNEIMQSAINRLTQLSLEELHEFDEILATKLYALDAEKYAKDIGFGSEHYLSADMFLYVRCWVVAHGKAFYEQVMNDPALMPKDLEFESLLYLTSEAANQKGIDDYFYDTRISYETFSNQNGWKDADFPDNLPPGHRPVK